MRRGWTRSRSSLRQPPQPGREDDPELIVRRESLPTWHAQQVFTIRVEG
jgi:hypothetical protein